MKSKHESVPTMGAPAETRLKEDGWVHLAVYGIHPHSNGRQQFSKEAAREMVRYFNSLRGRLARRFGGIPVYIGHPDDPAFVRQPGHQDTRAYAWIEELQAREDGLWALPRWSAAGEEILNNAFYKFLSPRWAMKPLGDGIYQPARLLSVGLTNRPNIPGDPITETPERSTAQPEIKTIEPKKPMIEKITDKLGLPTETEEEQILNTLNDLLEDSRQWNEIGQSAANEAETLREEANRFGQLRTEAENSLAEAERTLANERTARIEMILEKALREARIRPSEKEQWASELQRNFDESLETLANAQPLLNTQSRTEDLAKSQLGVSVQRQFLEAVSDRMDLTGEDFSTAWSNTKKERRDLFDRLSQPDQSH